MSRNVKYFLFLGSCPNNSKELTDANLNFIKTHPLMNDAVSPFFGSPVLLRTGFNTGFTAIDVDPQVMAPDGSRFDVLFVGTSTGQLIKAVNSLAPKSRISARTVIIEEIELMSNPVKIGELVAKINTQLLNHSPWNNRGKSRILIQFKLLCCSDGGADQKGGGSRDRDLE